MDEEFEKSMFSSFDDYSDDLIGQVSFGKMIKLKRSGNVDYKGYKKEKERNEETNEKRMKKRASKSAPPEMSSKIPVSRKRMVVPSNIGKTSTSSYRRDPRFDDLSGHFNEGAFQKAFSFIDEMRESEISSLEGAIGVSKKKSGRGMKRKKGGMKTVDKESISQMKMQLDRLRQMKGKTVPRGENFQKKRKIKE